MADLRDVVEASGVELRQAGAGRLKGLCPIHSERTPSFFVFTDKNRFRCFGCNVGGDVYDFLKLTRGFSFRDAKRFLGEDFPAATAATMREAKRRRAERAAAEWHEREVAWTLGKAIRVCNAALRRCTPETLDQFALILQELQTIKYHHNLLIHGDAEDRAELLREYAGVRLFDRRLLFRRDFNFPAIEWAGMPNDGNRPRGTSVDTSRGLRAA